MIYELIFHVDSPIITSSEINIDSLFCGVSPAAHNKDFTVDRQTKDEMIDTLPIPIDCAKVGGRYIYCSSCADYSDGVMICEVSTKRKDGEDILYFHKKLTPRSGIEKDCMMKLYGVACSSVKFRLSSSHGAEVERYAKRLKSIGAMRKQGYGHVKSFELIEKPELEWRNCLIENGKALRNIPQCFLMNEGAAELRCLPPYWLNDGREKCAAVGDEAELRDDIYLSPFRK